MLLVDEEARWEYHYLAATLQRDPTLRLDRVLFVPPRLGIAKSDDLDRAGSAAVAPADRPTPRGRTRSTTTIASSSETSR